MSTVGGPSPSQSYLPPDPSMTPSLSYTEQLLMLANVTGGGSPSTNAQIRTAVQQAGVSTLAGTDPEAIKTALTTIINTLPLSASVKQTLLLTAENFASQIAAFNTPVGSTEVPSETALLAHGSSIETMQLATQYREACRTDQPALPEVQQNLLSQFNESRKRDTIATTAESVLQFLDQLQKAQAAGEPLPTPSTGVQQWMFSIMPAVFANAQDIAKFLRDMIKGNAELRMKVGEALLDQAKVMYQLAKDAAENRKAAMMQEANQMMIKGICSIVSGAVSFVGVVATAASGVVGGAFGKGTTPDQLSTLKMRSDFINSIQTTLNAVTTAVESFTSQTSKTTQAAAEYAAALSDASKQFMDQVNRQLGSLYDTLGADFKRTIDDMLSATFQRLDSLAQMIGQQRG